MKTAKALLQKLSQIMGSWPVLCLLTYALLLIGDNLGIFIISLLYGILNSVAPDFASSPVWFTGGLYFAYIAYWVVFYGFSATHKGSRYLLKMASPKIPGNTIKNGIIGLVAGFALNGICILVAVLHGDIKISYVGFEPISFIFVFICVFIQSAGEEVVFRGYLYHKLAERYKPAAAVVLTALMFAIAHLSNPGLTFLCLVNIFIVGILLAFPLVYMKNGIWFSFGFHAAWNFNQSILFGLPNSGANFPYSVFAGDASTARNSFAYDYAFGIEGTWLSNVLLVFVCVALYTYAYKKKLGYEVLKTSLASGNTTDEKI